MPPSRECVHSCPRAGTAAETAATMAIARQYRARSCGASLRFVSALCGCFVFAGVYGLTDSRLVRRLRQGYSVGVFEALLIELVCVPLVQSEHLGARVGQEHEHAEQPRTRGSCEGRQSATDGGEEGCRG